MTVVSYFFWSGNHSILRNIFKFLLVITFTSTLIYLFMLFNHLCSIEGLLLNYWSIPIVLIWSSRRGGCRIPLITTYCCSSVSMERIELMALFIILYLTHWAAWEDLLLIWKHKYYLTAGGISVVVCNLTYWIGIVAFNGFKWVVVDVAWTL